MATDEEEHGENTMGSKLSDLMFVCTGLRCAEGK